MKKWVNWPTDIPQFFKPEKSIETSTYLWNILNIINKYQEENGNLVFNVKYLVNKDVVKVFRILTKYYNKIFITKPLSSSNLSTDQYIIAIEFKGISDLDKKIIVSLTEKWIQNKNKYIVDIGDISLHEQFIENILTYNKKLYNIYKEDINDFINKSNLKIGKSTIYPNIVKFDDKEKYYFDEILDKQNDMVQKWYDIITTNPY